MELQNELVEIFKVIGNSRIFFTFLVLTFIDIMLGKCRALKESEFSSYTGVKGLIKHILVILIVLLVAVCTRLLGYEGVGSSLAGFFILDYLVSIYANAEILGIPLPNIDALKPEIERKLGDKHDL